MSRKILLPCCMAALGFVSAAGSAVAVANPILDSTGIAHSEAAAHHVWEEVVGDHHVSNPHTPSSDPDHHAGDPNHTGNPHHPSDPQDPVDPHHTGGDPHDPVDTHDPDPHHHAAPPHHNAPPHHHAGDPHDSGDPMHLLGVSITTEADGDRLLHVYETQLGDINGDGHVDHSDAVQHFGATSFANSDLSLDGDINYVRFADGRDALILLDTAHLPESFDLAGALNGLSGNPVPEPSSVLLLLFGAASLLVARRKSAGKQKV